ncbi:MAG TPA: ATP-dependent zinc metalloprotease FtsH [Alphaproteobacteria bacterium]|nr:ATP-dependent zinc metalloprotease FtsH [Alphaproteobacteria bacterium]
MRKISKWIVPALLIVALLLGWRYLLPDGAGPNQQPRIAYSQFKSIVAQGEVAKVTMRERQITAALKRPLALLPGKPAVSGLRTTVPSIGDDSLLPAMEKAGVEIGVSPAEGSGLSQILIGLLPIILIIAVYVWLWRGVFRNMTGGLGGGGGGGIDKFLDRPALRERKKGSKVTFDDVAGQENAKRDVSELLDYLRDPGKYLELGADIPHGVLLVGPPGTGKTLLARALAGEAEVPFFSISASAFIEVFVGVGASRVRKMFDGAKKNAPAIIFIDELDAIGRIRGTGIGGGHDEREQTLNQILAEMDGFEGHEAVIVLAATNRPDVLDPALMRPGRFDRHVTLELPDKAARAAILKVHIRDVPLAGDVDLAVIAAGTPGFSGADLKNLVNEAAMFAARESAAKVTARHFDEMRDKVMMGAVRALAIQPEERHRLAVHEAGHTLAAHFLPHADPLHKVTIIPRGMALGATQLMPEEERHTLPEEYLKDRLAMLLAGRSSERVLLGSVSSGADDDIRQATVLARAMVTRWGMSEEIGPIDLRESEEHPFLGREIAQPRHFSDQTAHEVDREVAELLREAETRGVALIGKHRAGLDTLIAALEDKETLERGEIETCLGPGRPRKAPVRAEDVARDQAKKPDMTRDEEEPEPPHESPASKGARTSAHKVKPV